MNKEQVERIACNMLSCARSRLPAELARRLHRTCELIYNSGGLLQSRQVIAMIIMQYEVDEREAYRRKQEAHERDVRIGAIKKPVVKYYCKCEKVDMVARDMHSTCGSCGGVDAYKRDILGRRNEMMHEKLGNPLPDDHPLRGGQ